MASSDVAAATAAYDVLRTYFPHAAGALDTDYANFLAGVPNGVGRVHGLRVGHDAANALIASRVGDGRDATVPPPEPRTDGATWVPTGSGDFQVPWLGFVRPLLLDSATQFPLDGPDALTSAAYAADFDEVKAMGGDATTGSDRDTLQTETARFFSDHPVRQYQDAMRLRAQEHAMDILATARMFASANSSGADALIACWRGKYDFNFWRPITAIRQAATDGNDATTPNDTWTPLLTTPPYPDYPSGHGCFSSSVARALEHQFGAGNLDLAITSNVTGTTRDYDDEQAWLDDVVNARIWLGIHFRDAMDDARTLGRQVADHDAASFDPAG
jgi:hypothetical protein